MTQRLFLTTILFYSSVVYAQRGPCVQVKPVPNARLILPSETEAGQMIVAYIRDRCSLGETTNFFLKQKSLTAALIDVGYTLQELKDDGVLSETDAQKIENLENALTLEKQKKGDLKKGHRIQIPQINDP